MICDVVITFPVKKKKKKAESEERDSFSRHVLFSRTVFQITLWCEKWVDSHDFQ